LHEQASSSPISVFVGKVAEIGVNATDVSLNI
jgi:hypothetical protein